MTSKKVLIPIPSIDFDPSETAIPWKYLRSEDMQVVFSTPSGKQAVCDMRMIDGNRLGPLASVLCADKLAKSAYSYMESSEEFKAPISWEAINTTEFDALLLPGGHAQGVKEYLESDLLKKVVVDFFEKQKPVAAVCHGVILAARSLKENGESVLAGYKSTCLLASQEMTAWGLTCLWLGNYYRTYPESVESEVKRALGEKGEFQAGPFPLLRDEPDNLSRGFIVRDRNYISARWPGDINRFSHEFLNMVKES